MQRLSLLLLLTFGLLKGFAQCAEQTEPKVLLVGDSWAWFMNTESTINNVFKTWGFSNYTFVSNATLAENGAQTDDFQKVDKQTEILNQLTANPSIEVVHLSIGGNDFLGDWKVSLSQGATDTLEDAVFVRLDSVIRFIKTCKPGIRILWSGYVYPNFGEVIEDLAPFQSTNPFYNTWSGMEFPTFIQINSLLNKVSDRMELYAQNDPQVDFIKCTGLMQYVYGQTSALTVPPGGTYAPYTVPLPEGDPNYPSPKTTMRDYGFTKDCYHLSTNGYRTLIGYHTQKFYHKFLMDDLYLLTENNTENGTVSSTGTIDTSMFLGEASGEQFATVLTFNTTTMADTTLQRASIFLRRQSVAGGNPVGVGTIQVKIKNGSFGTSSTIEAADFTATGDATDNPCVFGSYGNDGDWVRLDLPASVLSHITNAAPTQFIITAPGFTAGKETFYNSSDPDFAPVLNLKYGTPPSGIKETPAANFSVYPNPTNGLLTIANSGETITKIEISNLLGAVVMQPQVQNTIDISNLPSGTYLLSVTTKKGTSSQRLVKE
ncbi:MAG: T9SS type A sorting domain-containing protein [Chitinophagales bacterium]